MYLAYFVLLYGIILWIYSTRPAFNSFSVFDLHTPRDDVDEK